ncbi:hypothetical protein MMC22_010128 [Lobaria immixta]|nr:hypothetical protein [Lobaria immixta]
MPLPDPLNAASLQLSSISRPILVTHHSSSLPSTPFPHVRKLSFSSRSPSPAKVDGQRSPRSARSESDGDVRSGGKAPLVVGCRFETGMAHSRRRIPYSIGGDQLERPKVMPKKYLSPAEEGKLSGDMRELYDRILPSKESDDRRAKFKQKLEHILNEQWPGKDIKVHVFGSSGNMLCSSDSDVDICITTSMKALEQVCLLAKALADHGMERVVCVPHAKVPIVKIWDPELELACDLNVNNTLALENTRMIKTYVEIDERVRPLAMIIKHWTKRRILNDAALGGTLSSYTWICMILNFLQTRNPPVLPCLHQQPQRLMDSEGRPSSFADDITALRGSGKNNKETLGELLFHFFRRYGHELDYEKNVLSVREGRLISKEGKKWNLMQNNRLCVEEPFNTERNLGNTADDISFRGVHLELRRAFDLISEAKLEECIKQYEFPAVEEKFWEKPPPRPVPVLSRSRSQSQSGRGGKGGYGTRGGKSASTQHRAVQTRRASSAAAMNKFVGLQAGTRSISSQDHALQAQFQQLHLHEQLFNEFQFLQAQENELRVRQAQAQLHAHAQAQSSNSTPALAQQTRGDVFTRSATINQASLSAPLRSGSFAYPLAYPPGHGTPHQSVHTNPPSPSMMPVQPELRRRVHRSSATDSDPNLSLRSHSQPARPIPIGFTVQNLQALPINANGLMQYQQLRQQHQQQFYNTLDLNQGQQRPPDHSRRRPMAADLSYEENMPKEYIGYYHLHDSPPPRPYREESVNARMPNYNDLPYRYRGIPPGISRLINPSRSPSPSPSMPLRDRSYSVRSASSAPPGPVPHERMQNSHSNSTHRSSGPIIVDGSGGWGLHETHPVTEPTSYSKSISEVTLASEDQGYDTSVTAPSSQAQGQGHHDSFSRETTQPYNHAHPVPEHRRIGDTSRNSIIEPILRRATSQSSEATTSQVTGKRSEYATNGHGLGIEFERAMRRPPTDPERLPPQEPAQHGHSASKGDVKSDVPALRYDFSPKTVPLLSPVREVRTPSPTANRKEDIFIQGHYPGRFLRTPMHLVEIPPFSNRSNGKQEHSESPVQKPNGKLANFAESPQTTQQSLTNGWQQPSKKGKKTKSKSQSQMPVLMPGELFPVSEAERKGG